MLKLIMRSIAALIMVGSMVYTPLMIGYLNIRGESLSVIDAFIAGIAVMCYLGFIYRGKTNEKEVSKG